jgi:hypothetical protein
MAEITAQGYQDLRDYIETTWVWHELRDATTTPIIRISTADPRVSWTHVAEAQTLELTTIITGSDGDITSLPQTFASSALYKVATGGDAFSVETFTQFTIEATNDQLTIKHRIEVPRVI